MRGLRQSGLRKHMIWVKHEKNISNIRENRAYYDSKINFPRNVFGQKYIVYLCPKSFNSMPTDKKKSLYTDTGNFKITGVKKIIKNY